MQYQSIRKPVVITTAVIFHALLIFHLLFSPVIIVMAAWKGIINASFISFALIFLLSFFFGRAFCSWFCPGCGMQEILNFLVKKKSKNSKALYIKYVIFSVWLVAIITGYAIMGFREIDLALGMTDITIIRKIILTLGAAVIIIPLTLAFGMFASCKYICWMAPFMIIGQKARDFLSLPGLRLAATSDKCKKCGDCDEHCPMNLDVMNNVLSGKMEHTECILCGNCIDHCNKSAIRFVIR